MNREEKQKLIEEINQIMQGAELVVVSHQHGLNVPKARELRRLSREAGAKHKVTKNRLAKIAIKGTKFEVLDELLKGPTAMTWSNDPIAAAKVIVEFAKQNEQITIVGGALNGILLDASQIKALATMPSLDELRSTIIGVINAPATKIAGVIQAPVSGIARVISAYAEKNNS